MVVNFNNISLNQCVQVHYVFFYILMKLNKFTMVKVTNPLENGDQLLRTNEFINN
jgi:hypothetical protein